MPARDGKTALGLLLLALLAAIPPARHVWLCDDVFITFRYVQQALTGHGLVYNVGERVEGYTHFLWTIFLWAGAALGCDLETIARWLPLPFYVGSVVVLARASTRLFGPQQARTWCIPVAAVLWALHHEAHVFASGGLETAAFTFFLLLGYERLIAGGASDAKPAVATCAYSVAALLRPEGIVHLGLALGAIALGIGAAALPPQPRFARQRFVRAAWLALVLLLPLWTWRWIYYGDLVPNSFHAKSAAHPYWRQGWTYVALYMRYYAPLLVSVPGAILVFMKAPAWRTGSPALSSHDRDAARAARAPLRLALAHAAATILMTAYVGGDFMFARFMLPATPFLCLLCEHVVLTLPRFAPAAAAVLVAGIVAGGMWRERALHGNVAVHGIADERSQYPPELMSKRRQQSALIARCFASTSATFLVQGSQACYAYWARFPVAIEAYGLTDRFIAHQPLRNRGRPGHERQPPLDYLLQRHTNFLLHLPGARPRREFARIQFGELLGEIIVYDRALMDQVRGCDNVRCTDFPSYFDAYLERATTLDAETVRQDAESFRRYYFDHNTDLVRTARLEALLRSLSASHSPTP